MAHLMQGSLRVRKGDRVREGQQIGQVGNSGNTSQPHLHIEMLDGFPHDLSQVGTLDFEQSGIPLGFKSVMRERGKVRRFAERVVPRRLDMLSNEG